MRTDSSSSLAKVDRSWKCLPLGWFVTISPTCCSLATRRRRTALLWWKDSSLVVKGYLQEQYLLVAWVSPSLLLRWWFFWTGIPRPALTFRLKIAFIVLDRRTTSRLSISARVEQLMRNVSIKSK